MKTVYLIRHGQSADNASPVFQSPDSPLTPKGRAQAQSIAERVSKLTFDSLIVSPFQRAKETADAITQMTGKVAEYSDLFVERIKPTSINGKSYGDKEADRAWREWEESTHTSGMRVEDGENFDDLMARADKALAFLTARPEESIVVVTHGVFLRMLVARVLFSTMLSGPLFKNFQRNAITENTGMTVLIYTDAFEESFAWRLWVYNDHAHLG